ncbi:MAG TPA: glucan biosynthesis protein [Chthoniobacterales bacterium]
MPDSIAGHWRAEFDFGVMGTEPVEMRLFLRQGDNVLSETWLCQYLPLRPTNDELANER